MPRVIWYAKANVKLGSGELRLVAWETRRKRVEVDEPDVARKLEDVFAEELRKKRMNFWNKRRR